MQDRWRGLTADGRHRASGAWDDRLLDSHLASAAACASAQVAVIDGERRISYGELDDLVGRMAMSLLALGVEPGDVVSWQLPNWWEAFVAHHAAIRIGAVSNPLMPILRERELLFMLAHARTRVLLVPENFRGFAFAAMAHELQTSLPELEHVIVVRPAGADDRSFSNLVAPGGGPVVMPAIERSADDPVLLLYTSGTEADPKGAVHSHNTLGYEVRSIIELYEVSPADVVFMPSPVAHITGVLYGLHLPSFLAVPVVVQDVWEPAHALRLIACERGSFMVAATPFLHMLVHHPELAQHDVGSLRLFACGGADVSPALVRLATDQLEACVVRVYGSTEFPTLCSGRRADPLERRAESDGQVIGSAEARIVREDGSTADAGEVGELWARGAERFLGYLDPELTERATAPGAWFRTGDLATIDADGYIAISGRKKDIIIRGGENISSKEIEDLLLEHDSVREVAIVGMPDPVMVERACAFIVPREGERPGLEELARFLIEQKIARQKLPERLELVDELPKTPSGKIKKFELRTRAIALVASDQARGATGS
jgi:cyclohexanecarboxylate-CoA ligase